MPLYAPRSGELSKEGELVRFEDHRKEQVGTSGGFGAWHLGGACTSSWGTDISH